MTTTTTPRTATFYFVRTVVYLFMALTAVISFMHIVHTSAMLGLTWERWTVPFLVDGFAGLGLIGRSARFAASTRRAGTVITIGSGLLSLACNVAAGSTIGGRIYGVLIVVVFVAAEWYGTKLVPAAVAPTADEIAAEALAAKRSAAAVKAAATRKANAERAVKSERASVRAARKALANA
jgi:hypothetical protein